MHGRPDAVPQPGPGVGEQHHALDGHRVAPGAQEVFERAGRFVDLLAGRAPPVIGHFAVLVRAPISHPAGVTGPR